MDCFFFLTHNRGGPSPQGGLISGNEYNEIPKWNEKWKPERSEGRLDIVCFACWLEYGEYCYYPLLPSREKEDPSETLMKYTLFYL